MAPGDQDPNEPDMQKAIHASLHTRDHNQAIEFTEDDQEKVDAQIPTCQNRVSIEDRIKDLTMQAATELPAIYDSQGDTWVYIDAPQRQPEQDEHDYERYIKRYKHPMLMKKETLTKYSPGLAKLFGPTQQYRFLRRRKLANKLPSSVKYVIDLTPPSEGEEAVFLTTELCCSEGVRLWHQSNQIWNVSKTLVKGEEEFSSVSSKPTSRLNGEGSEAAPSTMLPLEYSPVRHRSAIERLLSALQGTEPILDSATKVWTTFAVAKNFEITHSPLEDYIIRWLRAYPNSFFLEVLPEASHQIADGLQNYDLARDSFAILVGEEALDSLRHAGGHRAHKRTTYGRKKEELPEHIHTRIEYASKIFLERINNDFLNLVGNGMRWIDELPEVRRLSVYWKPELQITVSTLKNLLKDYVRGAIYRVLCVNYFSVPGPELHRDGGHDLLPRIDRASVWAHLPPRERILTRTYWEALKSFSLFQGNSNLDIKEGWDFGSGPSELNPTEEGELQHVDTYHKIHSSELRAWIRDGQNRLDQTRNPDRIRQNAQQESNGGTLSSRLQALPDRTLTRPQDPELPWYFPPNTSDYNLYDIQRHPNMASWPKRPYKLPEHIRNRAQGVATDGLASSLIPSQPVDIPKATKRTQNFPDALSPPDKQTDFNFRTKWPFGAARDDPIAQVKKSVDNLHFSQTEPDVLADTESALEKSTNPRPEGIPTGIDPWRGHSDRVGHVNELLQHLPFQTDMTPSHANSQAKKDWTGCKPCHTGYGDHVQQDLAPKTPWGQTTGAYHKTLIDNKLDKFDIFLRQPEDEPPLEFFKLTSFFSQAQNYINRFASSKLRCSDRGYPTESLELGIVNTLVCLEDSEWKYLPLWAGGNDDGSNGVFNDDLPTAEHGFTTAGPEVHDGLTPVNSVKAPSEFEFISAGDSASSFNASTATNRGFSDTVRRDHGHAIGSADDSASDSFTVVTPSVDSDDEETFARMQIEAQERIEAEEAAAEEARRIMKDKGTMIDEDQSYADLYDDDDDEEEEDDGNDTDRARVDDDDNEEEDDEDLVMV